jgi:hypothetical protein
MPKQDGGPSITQESVKPSKSGATPYTSGANVGNGKGPSPSKQAPAAQPKGKPW